MKKTTAFLLSLLLVFSLFSVTAFAKDSETDYTISNPYDKVDWDNFETYKANLHTHTTASDGDVVLTDMVEAYYKAGYDILSITDHGVINDGWLTERKTYPVFNKFRKVKPMSADDYERITTGADRDSRGMIDITGGIETNMATISKVHVNGYFTTWGNGVWGTENDYKTATVEIEKAGGYSVLNHVGDWINSNNYPERSHESSYIAYFADIFTSSKSCLGMEIVNGKDNVSRADRALWDELLQVVIPEGRNVWAFSDDDSEQLYEIGNSFELFPLKENTEENVKQAMADGSFFSASKFDKTDRQNEFEGTGEVPLVKKIIVNQEDNTISVVVDENRDCSKIEWIANGKVISDDYTIDLNDFENELGCYVRFQLHGEGGVTYSQAFELQYDGRVDKPVPENNRGFNFISRYFPIFYHTRVYALLAFIAEKIGLSLKIIPKN